MRIAIVGGGASGVFAAIKIKELHPDYDVTIFEHNNKLLKKIYATGNGKCNFANVGDLHDKYNHEDFVLKNLEKYGAKDIIRDFDNYGIHHTNIGNLIYPTSMTAITVADKLEKRVSQIGIHVSCETEIIEYAVHKECIDIFTSNNVYHFDKIVFSTGGLSSSIYGNTNTIFDLLSKHNYNIIPLKPSLCPVKIKENTKKIEGLRHNVKIAAKQNGKLIHEEVGELLFKDGGLSGIVMFNMTHYINMLQSKTNVTFEIDFVPEIKQQISSERYDEYVHPKIAQYLSEHHLKIDCCALSFKDFYDFKFSQVSSGGVSLKEINENFMSIKEKNIFFVGEILDIDAVCGGYNLMWAFSSAYNLAKSI